MGASPPVEARVLEQLEALLDRLQPSLIDLEESSAIDGTFTLTHRMDPLADIVITVHRHHTDVDGLTDSKEISDPTGEADDEWTAESIAESVEDLLRGTYLVETTQLGRRMIRTTVTTSSERTVILRSLLDTLPIPNRLLQRSHRTISYGITNR